MALKWLLIKTAWVLLILGFLLGAGRPAAWAGEEAGRQVVLVLDGAAAVGNDRFQELSSQALSLLVHLFKEQDCLGLVSARAPETVLLPADRLTPGRRGEILGKLARLPQGASPKPLAEVLPRALEAFQASGPGPRDILILSAGAQDVDPQKKTADLESIRRIADQARTAGVTISAVALSPPGLPEALKTLARASGGRFWEAKAASDLPGLVLNFYQLLVQPQEAPLQGTNFRLDQWVRQAVVVAARSGPAGAGVGLVNPAGARLTPRSPVKNLHWVTGPGYDLITISQPSPGLWGLAGVQPGDCRVFLDTGLTLNLAGTPTRVAADEALLVTALLSNQGNPAGGEVLTGAEIWAHLQAPPEGPLTTALKAPGPGAPPALPPGALAGRFPPLHQEGEATLRVLAQGKTFHRLVVQPITMTPPWYRPTQPVAQVPKPPEIRFLPAPDLHAAQVSGSVTLQAAPGALSGVLIAPAPGAEIILTQPPGCLKPCQAELQLRGVGPGGRPILIDSGPFPKISLEAPHKPPEPGAVSAANPKVEQPPPRKSKRRWLFLALMGFGGAVLLGAGLLFWREGQESGEAEVQEGADSKSVLMLQAQVEALTKDKAQLQATLEEKGVQAANLLAEKADLQSELERISVKTKDSVQSIEVLEKKLEEAEKEAQGFQQEYMALYARNQEEKQNIKKE